MAQWQPRKFKPAHIHIIRLAWQGHTNFEIASHLGCTEQHVSNIINCDEGQALLAELKNHSISSMTEVQDELQLVTPLILREKIRLALESSDEKVRSTSCSDLLAIAGHTPVRKLEIHREVPDTADLSGKTNEELRSHLLKELGIEDKDKEEKPPKGTLLN